MSIADVILVGGFLGAGKTTLLARAAERLAARGRVAAVVTNDQAANLVDSAVLTDARLPVAEVSGGCFCCRFDDLAGAFGDLVEAAHPDVLLGEPVGSCTDISATVLQPIKAGLAGAYRLLPYTVLLDPDRVRPFVGAGEDSAEATGFPDDVRYIYRTQLEEADILALNKIDRLDEGERARIEDALRRQYPGARVVSLSAKDGTGVDAWLDLVLAGAPAGRTITAVDYDVYAAGEAALGWFNAAYRLDADAGADWEAFAARLLGGLRDDLGTRGAEVAHLKIHLAAGADALVGNLTRGGGEPAVRGAIAGGSQSARLLVNARVHLGPDDLRMAVERALARAAGGSIRFASDEIRSFAPARPVPKHRHRVVVA